MQLLSRWFVAKKLSLSIDKTCYSIFGTQDSRQDLEVKINSRIISRVQNCKYLSTYIDSCLSWKEHIDYVYKNC